MRSTTARYVALIRGVSNIGTTNRVSMADLRVLFERLGFQEVATVLNSGNVVFSAPNHGRAEVLARIEQGLASKLGISSRVTVLSGREVAAAVRDNPFSDVSTDPSHLLVVVPRTQSDRRWLRPLLEGRWAPEALGVGRRVAYLWCANGVARSPLWAAVDRALQRSGTARNMATFTRILTLAEGPPFASRADSRDR